MRISATGLRTKRGSSSAGFTLVELMVVLLVIGLSVSVVSLTVSFGADDLATERDRLAVRLEKAAQEAVVTGVAVAFVAAEPGYQFYHREDGEWVLFPDRHPLSPTVLNDETEILVQLEGDGGDERVIEDLPPLTDPFRPAGQEDELAQLFRDDDEDEEVEPDFLLDPLGFNPAVRISLSRAGESFSVVTNTAGEIRVDD